MISDFRNLALSEGMPAEYAESMRFIQSGDTSGVLEVDWRGDNNEPLHLFVEFDTRPHEIEGFPLAFEGSSSIGTPSTIFTRKVQHPGTTGKHIVERAEITGRAKLEARLKQEIISHFGGLRNG